MAFSTGCGFLPARSPRRATWASQLCRKSRPSTATATWFIPQSQWCGAWTCSKNGSSRKTKGDFTELAVFPWIMGYQPLQPTSSTAHGWLFFGITQRRGGPIWRHLGSLESQLRQRFRERVRNEEVNVLSQMLHVWHIYLHLVDFWGKCRWIFMNIPAPWSIWV